MKLFRDWSIVFTSKSNLYLLSFDKTSNNEIVTTNVTIKHFLKILHKNENILHNVRFTNVRYHNVSSKLVLLSNHGRLYTFDTRTLQVNYLRISDRVIDFSIDENNDALYYVTASRNELLCVLRAHLIVSGNNELSVDDSIFYTELSVFTTNAALSRLALDYIRESLFLFVMINNQMFSYEMKLSIESRALLQLCGRSCANNRKLQIFRPWLNANEEASSLFTDRQCRSLNFLVSRDRLLDLEMICPTISSRVYRIEVSRKYNWAEDFRRSNFTARQQSNEYLFSTLIDVNDLTISSNFIPLRLIISRDPSNDTRYLHMERILYSNQIELTDHRAPTDERLNQVTRHRLAQINRAWSNVDNVDSMYVRSEHLLNELPFLINHMIKSRAIKKYHRMLSEKHKSMMQANATNVSSNSTNGAKKNDTTTKTVTDRIQYEKIPTLNTRTSRPTANEDGWSNDEHTNDFLHPTTVTVYIIVICVLVVYSLLSTLVNIVQRYVATKRRKKYALLRSTITITRNRCI